jgi:hypothetical protein
MHWYDGLLLRDALGHAPEVCVQAASVKIDVAPHSGVIYQAAKSHTHYTYFKPRNWV